MLILISSIGFEVFCHAMNFASAVMHFSCLAGRHVICFKRVVIIE